MSPPENALVPCVEEKSRIQALERSQPVPPMRPGKPEGHTPEYHRHGTTSLFAALDVKTGKVLGKCYPRHRAKEFITFLKSIETHIAEEVAAGKEVHLVLDNYATHKSATVMKWLFAASRSIRFKTLRSRCPGFQKVQNERNLPSFPAYLCKIMRILYTAHSKSSGGRGRKIRRA
ncbi:MAG: transposase [Luteolibacter sp.]